MIEHQQGVASNDPKTLPVFRLSPPAVSLLDLAEYGHRIFGLSGYETQRSSGRLSLRSGDQLVELHLASGGVWAADRSRLWRTDAAPDLPDARNVRALADRFAANRELFPRLDDPFRIDYLGPGATRLATFDRRGEQRADRELDVQARYAVSVALPGSDTAVPVVGGGGKFKLFLGDGGNVIGYSGSWRPTIDQIAARALSIESLDQQFKTLIGDLELEGYDSFLAYYSAPPSDEQSHLYPVRVYQAVARVDERRVPLRGIILAASDFGPELRAPVPQPIRSPRRRSVEPGPADRRSLVTLARGNPFEAGTSWIGQSGGLSGSQNNAAGFVNGLADDGWLVNFNWGDSNAWESDWHRNDDDWVDAADFVFYTGHASMDGWVLRNPDDGSLDFSEVGPQAQVPGDMWGQQDLEWTIVAACGPLQDEVISKGGGDVFARWGGAFDGLHLLLGYGAITNDNEDEGRLIVQYAREGETLINAWFRTATEVQPSTNGAAPPNGPDVWVGVVFAYQDGVVNPENDHLWGHGSVAADPRPPDGFVAMWTTT
jgi:hypothetical protein